MARHGKPVTGTELHRHLDRSGYEVRPQKGGNMQVAVIRGTEIRVPVTGKKNTVTPDTLGRIAAAEGRPVGDLLADLGRPVVVAGKPRSKPAAQPAPGLSKSEVLDQAVALRHRTVRIENWLKQGTHSSDLYRRVDADLRKALSVLEGYPPASFMDADLEARLSPDDRRYRPTTPDALTTGVARATGATAAAAKRGRTYTRYELNQRDGAAS